MSAQAQSQPQAPSSRTPLLHQHTEKLSSYASQSPRSSRLPQNIAHRGFKARYPENTLLAFRGAVDAGAEAIETDLHLSRDGVVVLSHDPSLQRCFGLKDRIVDCDWEFLQTLRTRQAPHEPMPRLLDLLQYLNQPELEHVWILLDIKLDNDPSSIISLVAETIRLVPRNPAVQRPWHSRIVLGCWSARYLPLCATHLPAFPITLICFDISYARRFLAVPNVSFNVNQKVLMGPLGRGFLDDARAANRPVYVWTVNEPALMRWSIARAVDGVITDDPVLFRQIRAEYAADHDCAADTYAASRPCCAAAAAASAAESSDVVPWRLWREVWVTTFWVVVLGWFFRWRYLPSPERVRLG